MPKDLLPVTETPQTALEKGNNGSLGSPKRPSSPLLAGLAYCSVSAAMMLLNKHALSSFNFSCPNSLILAQCLASVVIVKVAEAFGCWKVLPLRWDIVKVCCRQQTHLVRFVTA
jgi:hypothetical protein